MRIILDTHKNQLIVPDNFFHKMEQLNAFRVDNGLTEVEPLDYIKTHFEKAIHNPDECLKRKSEATVKRIPGINGL